MKAILKVGNRELDLVCEYTGHPYDPVLGVYYARARMYDAADRRFMAVDPVKGWVANPATLVQYSYVVNNPLKYADPWGLNPAATEIKGQPYETVSVEYSGVELSAKLIDGEYYVSIYNISLFNPSVKIQSNSNLPLVSMSYYSSSSLHTFSLNLLINMSTGEITGAGFTKARGSVSFSTPLYYQSDGLPYVSTAFFAKIMCSSGIQQISEWVLPRELEMRKRETGINNEITRLSLLVHGKPIDYNSGTTTTRRAELFSMETVEILARLIHYEADEIDSGQTQVMWSIINRVFKGSSFISGGPDVGAVRYSIRGVITGSQQYATVWGDEAIGNQSYRPDKTVRHWENSILLSAITCAYFGDSTGSTLTEDDREFISSGISKRRNINGNLLTNLIGDRDSFHRATKAERETGHMVFGRNHFYNYPHP